MKDRSRQTAEELRERIESLRRPRSDQGLHALNLEPISAFEAVTRERLDGLSADVHELKQRVNYLIGLVAGAVIVATIERLVSGG